MSKNRIYTKVDICPICGLRYDKFKTGLTYNDIYCMMFVGSDNVEKWVYKRRRNILRFWHKLKTMMFDIHINECSLNDNEYIVKKMEY